MDQVAAQAFAGCAYREEPWPVPCAGTYHASASSSPSSSDGVPDGFMGVEDVVAHDGASEAESDL